jgi:hypothetical protein
MPCTVFAPAQPAPFDENGYSPMFALKYKLRFGLDAISGNRVTMSILKTRADRYFPILVCGRKKKGGGCC